jgi:hypothetical protein
MADINFIAAYPLVPTILYLITACQAFFKIFSDVSISEISL